MKALKAYITVGVLLLYLLLAIVGPASGEGGIPGPGSGSSEGEGNKIVPQPDRPSPRVTIDTITNIVRDAKKAKSKKFEELQTLLGPEIVPPEKGYILPIVLMYYAGNNTSVTRNRQLEIGTVVTNNNNLETRRMLNLYLEVKDPGSNKYERINSWPVEIQPGDYSEKTNTTLWTWDMLPSFSYLKRTGEARVRVSISDGVKRTAPWTTASYSNVKPPYYTELIFNITNSLPVMSNMTLTPEGLVTYNDPIEYKASIEDADKDMLNVTLHILDEQQSELNPPRNKTLQVKSGDQVSFRANEYGFFSEADAGKNFTYFYSFDDGINSSKTEIQNGPYIRKGPKLYIENLDFAPQSESNYWWQWYTFNVRAKNLNPEEYDVTFTLWTKTGENDWITVGDSQNKKIGPNPKVIWFNRTEPFKVTDANETFSYKVTFNEYDQSGKKFIEAAGTRLNAKIMPYSMSDRIILLNLFPMLLLIVIGSLLIERNKKRGIESQERSLTKSDSKNNQKGYRQGNGANTDIANKISGLLGRN